MLKTVNLSIRRSRMLDARRSRSYSLDFRTWANADGTGSTPSSQATIQFLPRSIPSSFGDSTSEMLILSATEDLLVRYELRPPTHFATRGKSTMVLVAPLALVAENGTSFNNSYQFHHQRDLPYATGGSSGDSGRT